MAKLTINQIQIAGPLAVDTLTEFSISAKVNEHGELRYSGVISESVGVMIMEKTKCADTVRVYLNGELAFTGQPLSVSVSERNSVFFLTSGVLVALSVIIASIFIAKYISRIVERQTETMLNEIHEADVIARKAIAEKNVFENLQKLLRCE